MADFDFNQFKQNFIDGVNNVTETVATGVKETTADVKRFKHFYETGKDLFRSGLTTSHGGNLSVSDGESIWITQTGTMLGRLSTGDVCKVYMSPTDLDAKASMELVVHRAMYRAWAQHTNDTDTPFGTKAIIHAHSKFATYCSLVFDTIAPLDSEGLMLFGDAVEVIFADNTVASEEVANKMYSLVSEGGCIAAIRGHGSFAIGDTLEDALRLISAFEYSSELLTIAQATGKKIL